MKLCLNYHSEKTTLTVRDEVVAVKAFQIIVWISVSSDPYSDWDPRLLKFPAILDTGHNHNLALTESHLMHWARIQMAVLPAVGAVRERGEKTILRDAGVWLHTDAEPFKLDVIGGITVHSGNWPRLPILGLRALTNSKLQTLIYGDTKQVVIRTPPNWYWPF